VRVGPGRPFADLTTLRLGGPARDLVEAGSAAEVIAAVKAVPAGEPLFVFGGGSNLVVADDGFDGTAVRVVSQGVQQRDLTAAVVQLEVAAGEPWDAFVADCVVHGLAGIEALSGIPGTVGAAPVQNIGAYGQAVGEHVLELDVLDRSTGRRERLSAEDCEFAYRDSRLKREVGRYVVLAVTFVLPRAPRSAPVRHRELAAELGIELGGRAPVMAVREAVLRIRARKGMVLDSGDHDTWSAGSFFVNPVLAPAAYEALQTRSRELVGEQAPAYPEGEAGNKVPAAWLIEHSGFAKGYPLAVRPQAGIAISTKHPLALTNRGHGTATELVALAREIAAGVGRSFGVSLQPEPQLLGLRWGR
jgi:UDP-N-acetylmuramate dehydrogenase